MTLSFYYRGVYKVNIEAVLIKGCSYFGQQTNKEVSTMLALSPGSSQFLCNIENWVELGDKASTHLHVVLHVTVFYKTRHMGLAHNWHNQRF